MGHYRCSKSGISLRACMRAGASAGGDTGAAAAAAADDGAPHHHRVIPAVQLAQRPGRHRRGRQLRDHCCGESPPLSISSEHSGQPLCLQRDWLPSAHGECLAFFSACQGCHGTLVLIFRSLAWSPQRMSSVSEMLLAPFMSAHKQCLAPFNPCQGCTDT